jgi:hypothetical protein
MAETSGVSDEVKRNLIVERLGVGANTAAGLKGKALDKAYSLAKKKAEAPPPVIPKRNKGGVVKKKKPVKKLVKGGFPDLTGDGKVTKADVLKGRGVAMNKGGMKKQYGAKNYMHGGSVMGKKKK